MKLLFLCSEYPPGDVGGIGVVLKGLCEGLAAQGHEVHVVGSYGGGTGSEERQNGVVVHRLPGKFGRAGILVDGWRIWQRCREIARPRPIDLLEAPDFEAPGGFLPRVSRRRVVRLHGSQTYFAKERNTAPARSIRVMERVQLAKADAWISVSTYTARQTAGIFGLDRRTHVVHNCPAIPASATRKTDYGARRQIVYFGTLAEKKGVFPLVSAWRSFHDRHPDWSLTFIGRDALHKGRSVQEQLIENLGPKAQSVHFAAPVSHDELLRRLPEYDFAVLPSYSEAFAMAPMEAMGLGVPLLYSNRSSGPELIVHGQDGWLVDPDDTAEFTRLLTEIASDSGLRARVAAAGRQKIETEFSACSFIDRNLATFEEILVRELD